MGLLVMNLAAIAIIICCKGVEGQINLAFFERLVVFRQETLQGPEDTCEPTCDNTQPPESGKKIIKPLTYNETGSYMDSDTKSYCNGYVSQCQYLSGTKKNTLEYCHEDEAVVWLKSSVSSGGIGKQPKGCMKNELKYSKKGEHECHVCMCHCINEKKHPIKNDVWYFSLAEQLSDTTIDKVVVGVRFTNYDRVIRLELKENDIKSKEPGVWKNATSDLALPDDAGNTGEHLRVLTHDFRTIMLDTILLPEDTVITGMRFEEVKSPNGMNALRLRVRGTKLNADKSGLSDEADWYGAGHGQDVSEWWSSVIHFQADDTEISFEAKNVNEDMGEATIPTLDPSNIESCTRHDFPLSGLRLSLVRLGGRNTMIVPAVHPHFLQPNDIPKKPKKGGADTTNLQFILMAMLPWVIISNLSN